VKRPSAATPRLSREEIAKVGLKMLEAGGVDQLSMRALASEFGVWPNALYQYFRDKDELLALILDYVLEELEVPPPGPPWIERMLEFSENMHQLLTPAPDLAGFLMHRAGLTERVRSINYQTLILLRDGGYEPRDAVEAFISIYTYILGSLSLVRARSARLREGRQVDILPHAPTDPAWEGKALRDALANIDTDRQFAVGLRQLLEGIESGRSSSHRGRSTTPRRTRRS
jgi:TetR/AcrR family tetracycline transcriptional repressor